jgi:hypothetical protein
LRRLKLHLSLRSRPAPTTQPAPAGFAWLPRLPVARREWLRRLASERRDQPPRLARVLQTIPGPPTRRSAFRIRVPPGCSAFGGFRIPHSALRILHWRNSAIRIRHSAFGRFRIPQSAFYIGEIPHSRRAGWPSWPEAAFRVIPHSAFRILHWRNSALPPGRMALLAGGRISGHSAFRNPHSTLEKFRTSHSAFRIHHSAFRIPS